MKKNIITKCLVVIGMITFTGGGSDFLDRAPLGELNGETFYNNESDFEAASLSAYSSMLNMFYSPNEGVLLSNLLIDDDTRVPRGNNEHEDFAWLPNEQSNRFLFSEIYEGIMRANVIIERLPGAGGFKDETLKTRFEGEARFLRAFFHFYLARNWGTPPVVKQLDVSIEDTRKSNSEPGEIWDFIIEDLEFAKNNLPPSYNAENTGRVTTWAAQALLGKVYLFSAQWQGNASHYQSAITELENVVNNGPFTLETNFNDNFSLTSENGVESIFEIQFTRGDFNTWLPTDFGLNENQNIGYAGTARKVWSGAQCDVSCAPASNVEGYGRAVVTTSLINEFEPNDPRREFTLFLDGDVYADESDSTYIYSSEWSTTGSNIAKYNKPFPLNDYGQPNHGENNERVIRLADVILMLAEAELLGNNDRTTAATLINRVRERARDNWEIHNTDPRPANLLPDLDPNAMTDAQMFDALMHERRVELAFEIHRYDDLVRWHRASLIDLDTLDWGNATANTNWSERNLLRPYPQREIDLAAGLLVQNPDY